MNTSLTDAELKVAALVAEGLTNPDIGARLMLSRRTVATHVSHILRKLGAATRADIARESARRGTVARLGAHRHAGAGDSWRNVSTRS